MCSRPHVWRKVDYLLTVLWFNTGSFHQYETVYKLVKHFLSKYVSSILVSGISLFPEMVDNVVHSQAWFAVAWTLITGGQESDYWSFQGYISLRVDWTLAVHCKCVCVCLWACVAPGSFTSAEHSSPITNLQMGTFSFSPFLSPTPVRLLLFFFFLFGQSSPWGLFLITYVGNKVMVTFYYSDKSCISFHLQLAL